MKLYVVLWQINGDDIKFIRAFDKVSDACHWNIHHYDGELDMTMAMLDPDWLQKHVSETASV
jgi:hypothetical protein